jgi:hypothetical protein
MSDAEKQIEKLLKAFNFTLVRETKYKVYRDPEGRVFVTSKTASDFRWAKSAIADLKKIISSSPRSEILTVADFEEREKAIQLERQAKIVPQRAGGGAGPKSNGTGILYRVIKVQERTEAEKAADRKRDEDERAAEAENQATPRDPRSLPLQVIYHLAVGRAVPDPRLAATEH